MWPETGSPLAADETAIGSAIKAAVGPMPDDARSAVRGRLTAMVESQRVPWFVSIHRWIAAALVASSMLGGTSYAAACSRPGDPLYPIRKTVERTWSKVTGKPQPADPAPAEQDGTPYDASEAAPKMSPAAEDRAGVIPPKTTTGDASSVDPEPDPDGASRPASKSSASRPEQQKAAGQSTSDAAHADEAADEDESRTEPDEPSVDTKDPEQPDADQEPSDDSDAGQVDGDDDHNDESSEEQPPLSPDEDDDPEEEE